MAIITSTPTAGSLTVSGTTPASGTITWSLPSIPNGATVSSRVLTGIATANMTSQKIGSITVNGKTVSSGSQFTVDLGANSSTTSISVSAAGGHKNSKGTVSFNNLVYTVTYEVPKATYTVTFKDWNGTVLKTEQVEEGKSATAPSNPSRSGYTFTGWDKSFNNVTSNLTITAQYVEDSEEPEIPEQPEIPDDTLTNIFPPFNDGAWYPENSFVEIYVATETTIEFDVYGLAGAYHSLDQRDIGGKTIRLGMDITKSSENAEIVLKYSSNGEEKAIVNHEKPVVEVDVPSDGNFSILIHSITANNNSVYIEDPYLYVLGDAEEEPDGIIEWSGVGTVASGLRAHDIAHDNYKINIDWDNECFDVIVTEDYNYKSDARYYNYAYIDPIIIGDNTYDIVSSVASEIMYIEMYGATDSLQYDAERSFPCTIRFTKEGVYILHGTTTQLMMERNYDLEPIYLNEDNTDNLPLGTYDNDDYDVEFDLVVSEYHLEDINLINIESIELSHTNIKLASGELVDIIASVSPENATEYCKWTISNDNVEMYPNIPAENQLLLYGQILNSKSTNCTITQTNHGFEVISSTDPAANVAYNIGRLNANETYILSLETNSNIWVEIYFGDSHTSFEYTEPRSITGHTEYSIVFYNNLWTTDTWGIDKITLTDSNGSDNSQDISRINTIIARKTGETLLTCSNQDGSIVATCIINDQHTIAQYKFDNTLADLFPEFNTGYTYTYEDVIEGNVTTRTIYSDDLPTLIRFGDSACIEGNQQGNHERVLSLLQVDYLNTNNINDMSYMFGGCKNVEYVNTSEWDTSKVTNMRRMFSHCHKIRSINTSGWDTSKVTNMLGMFSRCYELNSIIGIENLDVANVENMESMFYYTKVSELDLSNWKTDSVINIDWIFSDCYMLRSLNVTGWNTSQLTSLIEVFAYYERGNHNLIEIIGLNTWNVSNITMFEDLFWECRSLKSLDLSGWDMRNAAYISWMFCDCESLESLKLNDWHLNENVQYEDMFSPYEYSGCPLLASIEMKDSDYSSINKIISALPTRTSDFMGTLNIAGVDDLSQVNMASANSKYWNVVQYIIAQYKFDSSLYNLFPEFNEGFVYTYEDKIEGNLLDGLSWAHNTLIYDEDGTIFNGAVGGYPEAMTSDFIEVKPGVTYYSTNLKIDGALGDGATDINLTLFYWYTADKTYIGYNENYSAIAPNNAKYVRLVTDKADWDAEGWDIQDLYLGTSPNSIITRTIYSESLPTLIRFGRLYDSTFDAATNRESSLLEVISMDTSNITNMNCMFQYCGNLTKVNCNWDTSKVANMSDMFRRCYNISELDVSNWNTENVTTMHAIFANCQNLTYLDTTNWDTSKVTDMNCMFDGCSKLSTIDGISNWNTGEVLDMYALFRYCDSLQTLDLKDWDTSKVTTMQSMFSACRNLVTVNTTNWDTSNVTTMAKMFGRNATGEVNPGCESLEKIIGIENWDTGNVTTMEWMFYGAYALEALDLSKWDTSKVWNMGIMFCAAGWDNPNFSLNIKDWDVRKVQTMTYMFDCCITLKELDLSGWDVSLVYDMNWMFGNDDQDDLMSLTKLNLSGWKFNNAVTMNNFFSYTNKLNEVTMNNSNYVSVNKVIEQLLAKTAENPGTLSITNDLSQIDVATAKSKNWNIIQPEQYKIAEYKFTNSSNVVPVFNNGFEYIIEDVIDGATTTRIIKSIDYPTEISFQGLTALVEVNYLETRNLTSAYAMFYKCSNLTYVDLSHSDFSNMETLEGMFNSCSKLTTIDGLDTLNVSNVHNMGGLFSGCTKLTELNVNNWDVSKVTNFGATFRQCSSLTELNISNWNTENGQLFSGMLQNCSSLKSLDLSNLKINKATTLAQMFYTCSSLESLNISNWTINEGTSTTDLFRSCNNLKDVVMNNSDSASINKVISVLLTKTATDLGTLRIGGVDDISQVNISTAESKYWSALQQYRIAEYKFDNTISDLFPEFNEGYDYEYKDITEGNITIRIIYSDSFPIDISFKDKVNLTSLEFLDFNNLIMNSTHSMFLGCTSLTSINVSNWDVSGILSMATMLQNCHALENIIGIENWNTTSLQNTNAMFYGCHSLTKLNISNFDTSKVTNMSAMFYGCEKLIDLRISDWDTSAVTNMISMFDNCRVIKSLDLNKWDTSNVTDMSFMFDGCRELETLILNKWNTSKVTNMSHMFNELYPLKELDISGFDTSKVTNMDAMFGNLRNIEKINMSNFSTDSCTNTNNLFAYYRSTIKEIILNNSDYRTINKVIAQLPSDENNKILYVFNCDDIKSIDKETAESKNWKICIRGSQIINVKGDNCKYKNVKIGNKRIRRIHMGDLYL